MKYFSTFTGIGGFELGIGDQHECVGYSEIDKFAVETYKKHFPNSKTRRGRVGKKIAQTLDTGMHQYTLEPIAVAERGRYDDQGKTKQTLEARKDNLTNTLTSVEKDNRVYDGLSIRRLTPVECERLQGFPDGWTEGISDTQRYKTLGNAVTTNVIRDVAYWLLRGMSQEDGTEAK